MEPLSSCCKAPVKVDGDKDEGTNFYRCSACSKPCDILPQVPICSECKCKSPQYPIFPEDKEGNCVGFGKPFGTGQAKKEVDVCYQSDYLKRALGIFSGKYNSTEDGNKVDLSTACAIVADELKIIAKLDKRIAGLEKDIKEGMSVAALEGSYEDRIKELEEALQGKHEWIVHYSQQIEELEREIKAINESWRKDILNVGELACKNRELETEAYRYKKALEEIVNHTWIKNNIGRNLIEIASQALE